MICKAVIIRWAAGGGGRAATRRAVMGGLARGVALVWAGGLTLVPADGPRCPLWKIRGNRPAAEPGR